MALKLKGSTSGFVAVDCAAEGGNNTIILPSSNGVAGAVWANNVDTAGVATCTSITINKNGDLTVPGTVSVGGTLTYEDVTNVDSIGIITARTDIHLGDKLVHYGDTNTAIRFPAADTFTVETAGTEAIRVTSTQKVGIGTDSPGATFDVWEGNIRLQNSAAGADGLFIRNANSTFAWTGEHENSAIPNGAIGMTITNTDVATNKSAALLEFRTYRNSATSNPGGVYVGAVDIGDGTAHSSDCIFALKDGSTTVKERLRITHDGYIGIGTVAARGATLEVQDLGATGPCLLLAGATNTEGDIVVPDGQDINIGHWNNVDTFTERIRITSTGEVVIGTTASVDVASGSAAMLQVEHTSGNISAAFYSTVDAVGPAGVLALGHARGSATGVLQLDDVIGQIRFAGGDGTDLETIAAQISAESDGTPGSNDMPGRLVFSTTPDGAAAPIERMRITKNGNVGIGTTNPNQELVISSSAFTNIVLKSERTSATDQIGGLSYYNSAGISTATINGLVDGTILFKTAGEEKFRVAGDGDVTIHSGHGMFPGASLNVISDKNVETGLDDMDNYHLALKNPANDTGEAIGLAFGITDTDSKVGGAIIHHRDAAGSQGSLKFLTRPDNAGPPVVRTVIGSDGNIGIGSESPAHRIDILNPGTADGIHMKQTGNNYCTIIADCDRTGDDNAILYMRGRWNGTEVCRISMETGDDTTNKDNGQIKFWTKHSTATDIEEILEINEAGQVSIYGTDHEASLLRLYPTNAQTTPSIDIRSNCNSACANILRFYDEDTSVAAGKALGEIHFWSQDSGNAGVKAKIQGKADTGSPNGELCFQTDNNQTLNTNLRITYDGEIQTPNIASDSGTDLILSSSGYIKKKTSSRRYKKNIKSIEDSMADKMLECRPVWFQRNTEDDDTLGHYGFIAEEVQEVDPTFVVFEDKRKGVDEDGQPLWEGLPKEEWIPESVKYTDFVPLLLNLAKRQKAQIESLEKRLTELESA